MSDQSFVIGLDYGTDSVRSVLVNAVTGKEVSSVVFEYPRWKAGKYCDAPANQFRQHPLDYVEGLEHTIVEALKLAPEGTAKKVKPTAKKLTTDEARMSHRRWARFDGLDIRGL